MTDEEWDWLRRLGFEQSPFTKTRWLLHTQHPDNGQDNGQDFLKAWIELKPHGWSLSTWGYGSVDPDHHDTLGLELVPMLAFALAEGWL